MCNSKLFIHINGFNTNVHHGFLLWSVQCRDCKQGFVFKSGHTAKSATTSLLKQTFVLFLLVHIFDNGQEAFTMTQFCTDYVGINLLTSKNVHGYIFGVWTLFGSVSVRSSVVKQCFL